ncbi:MAG: hypothetical protein KAI66_18340, partial [Lentisphaeria bacterium]|nr:hypothetical protein [Lentisphaeria bacterium]
EQKPPGDPSKYRIRSFLPDAKLQPKLQQWGYTWWAGFFSTQHRFAKPEKVVHRDWIQRFGVVEGRGMLQLDTAFEDKQI